MITFTTKFASDNIDKANGVIKSVSLISLGQVQGHDCWADAKTLATVLAAAKKAKKLKCKIDHGNSVNQICGSLTNFRLSDDGQKVLGDLKLLKTSPSYDYVLELAEQLSGQVALSIAFNPEFEESNGKRLVRCVELYSADLVSDAAANCDGLFDSSATLTNTATVIPAGVKPKTRTINVVCPNCEQHLETFSKLAKLHNSAADKLSDYIDSLAQKDNVSSSIPTEAEFQRRLEAQKLELEKNFAKQASIVACRMLASTGISLSKIPDADTCMNSGDSVLDRLQAIKDPTEQGRFYQANKAAIQAAYQRQAAKNIDTENRVKATEI
jgi:hypothetical protein